MTKDERRLSARVRPDVEAAPWVVDAIQKLEAELDAAHKAHGESLVESAANTEALHRKVSALQARVQRLTDALEKLPCRCDRNVWANGTRCIRCAALAEGEDTP